MIVISYIIYYLTIQTRISQALPSTDDKIDKIKAEADVENLYNITTAQKFKNAVLKSEENLHNATLRHKRHTKSRNRRNYDSSATTSLELVEVVDEEDFYNDVTEHKNSPYDKIYKSLKIDTEHNPSDPMVVMSNIGPVRVYQQPVSKHTEKLIKKLTGEKNGEHKTRRPKKQKKINPKKLIRQLLKNKNGEGYNILIFEEEKKKDSITTALTSTTITNNDILLSKQAFG